MKKDKNFPQIGQVVKFIKENSPKNAKCIDADFLQMQGFCLLAWVIEKALTKNQGYQQACVALYQEGEFGEPKTLIPCRYYEEGGKRKATSCPFDNFSGETIPALLEKRADNQACVTLVCSGKPISRMLIQGEKAQKSRQK